MAKTEIHIKTSLDSYESIELSYLNEEKPIESAAYRVNIKRFFKIR